MTVKQLLEFIEKHNIPLDAEVRYQRITDYYFDNGGWKSIKKEGYPFNNAVEFNKKIDSGYYDDKERFPLITIFITSPLSGKYDLIGLPLATISVVNQTSMVFENEL